MPLALPFGQRAVAQRHRRQLMVRKWSGHRRPWFFVPQPAVLFCSALPQRR